MRVADDDTPTLPEDAAVLRALLLKTQALVDTLSTELGGITAERDALASQNERLQHLLLKLKLKLKLKRRQFGTKSERLTEGRLLFAFEEIEATLAGNAAEAGKASPTLRDNQAKRRRAGRGRLPAHLPRIEQVLAPEATACPCCRGPLVEIGTDAAERVDVIPARFRVVVTKRPKLACRACPGGVLQTPAPARLVEGGMPTEATVAHVFVSRYADHLPLYRQSQILARQGIGIGREVLADWTSTAAMEIVPVVRRMHELLLASPRLFADETTMPVLDPGRGRTKKGFACAVARDDRPWGGTDSPAVVFHYAPGRSACVSSSGDQTSGRNPLACSLASTPASILSVLTFAQAIARNWSGLAIAALRTCGATKRTTAAVLPVASSTTTSSGRSVLANATTASCSRTTLRPGLSRPSSRIALTAKLRCTSRPMTRISHLPATWKAGANGQHDNYGSALAAHPGKSRGRPDTTRARSSVSRRPARQACYRHPLPGT